MNEELETTNRICMSPGMIQVLQDVMQSLIDHITY